MADKAVIKEKKDYTLLRPLRRGSNKKGEPKKVYAKGDKILLTEHEAVVFNKQKLI